MKNQGVFTCNGLAVIHPAIDNSPHSLTLAFSFRITASHAPGRFQPTRGQPFSAACSLLGKSQCKAQNSLRQLDGDHLRGVTITARIGASHEDITGLDGGGIDLPKPTIESAIGERTLTHEAPVF